MPVPSSSGICRFSVTSRTRWILRRSLSKYMLAMSMALRDIMSSRKRPSSLWSIMATKAPMGNGGE